MADESNTQLSEETARLAALGRGEETPPASDKPAEIEAGDKPQRPEHIPEKFWDAETGVARLEDLAKAYAELEKKLGQPKDEPPANETGDKPAAGEDEGGEEDEAAAAAAALSPELLTGAREEFAKEGDLSEATREKIIAAGIDADTLDTYLAGVKALSEKLNQEIYSLGGGEERYSAAVKWAAEAWDDKQIAAYDSALDNPALRDLAVKGLMSAYEAANAADPGEGVLTHGGSGADKGGDVYSDPEEFVRDLQKADAENDALARRQAVAKLARSRKSGSIKQITPRTGFGSVGR